MSGLRMFLELRECKARSNSVSEGAKYLLTPTSLYMCKADTARANISFLMPETIS